MTTLIGLVILVLALTPPAPPATPTSDPVDLEVAVVLGATRIHLDVRRHFGDFAQALPDPGHLEPNDPAASRHGAQTLCFSYALPSGAARLELHDSDFGLHTATASRLAEAEDPQCPLLSSEPVFIVGDSRYTLSSTSLLKPSGFRSNVTPETVSFTREWKEWESDIAKCSWRSISVTAERRHGTIQSIMVQNWQEPGC